MSQKTPTSRAAASIETFFTIDLPYCERMEIRRTRFSGGDGPRGAVVSGIHGDVTNVRGDATNITGQVDNIYGDVSNLTGDVSRLTGCVSFVSGNATGMVGDCTGLVGSFPDDVTEGLRAHGLSINSLVND